MDDGSGSRVANAEYQAIERLHDVVIEHLIRNSRKRGFHERRRLFEDYIRSAVQRDESTRRSSGDTEREKVSTPRVLERRPGEEVPVGRVRRDADFDLDGWHGTFSHRVFLMPVRVSR